MQLLVIKISKTRGEGKLNKKIAKLSVSLRVVVATSDTPGQF